MNDIKSLTHSKWRCKYHIVFAPKYRRQIIYGKIKADIGRIVRQLCERKGVEVIAGECCPDHIHLLVSIPPHISSSQFMGYLKSKSSLMIVDKHANLKYKYGNRQVLCRQRRKIRKCHQGIHTQSITRRYDDGYVRF